MAEAAASSTPDPDAFPDQPIFDDDAEGEGGVDENSSKRRLSTSTTTSRRRQNYYDSQRINRPSRPTSWAGSQGTQRQTNPKSKRQSYQEPPSYGNVDEEAIPLPTKRQDNRAHLEDRGPSGSRPGSAPTRNFSQRDGARRRSSAARQRDSQQNLAPASGVPPVPRRDRSDERYAGPADPGDESEESSGPFGRRMPDDVLPQRDSSRGSRVLTELYTISYLIFFSILGTLARLGVQWITFYPGAPLVTPVTWANFGGSFIMGFLAEDQGLFREGLQVDSVAEKHRDADDLSEILRAERSKQKKAIPLYIGLAVGFCGCFTSFSSFLRDVFLALSNNLPTPFNHEYPSAPGPTAPSSTVGRNGGYSFEALVAVTMYTIALSLGGLILGAHLALALADITPTIPVRFVQRFLDPFMVLLGWGCWLGAIFMTIWPPDRPNGPASRGSWANETWRSEVLFALVFAPLGCLLRFYASIHMNGLVPAFPLGTFAANMFGTAVEGMCFGIQHTALGINGLVGGGRVGCGVLQGVMDGFCGSLTTVSTWVAEINSLKRKHGYGYAFASVLVGLCLMVVIMGSVRWTVGWSDPVCNTGYTSKVHG